MSESIDDILSETEMEMDEKVFKFKKDLSGLRTGRANPQLLDNVHVEYYGARTPLKQVAAISVPEPRTLEVRVWDANAVNEVESELRKIDFGSSPSRNGAIIRINLPPMTEDQRKKMVKIVYSMAEDFRVSIRNLRREALEKIKKSQKAGEITEDDLKTYETKVQKLTDAYIGNIDAAAGTKEKELLTV
ncbi:MAG: ribosome recycling factor [Elusimicrobiales bacterium]|nr:ribosome recycling factor [Elusimicrobiales bacterium]